MNACSDIGPGGASHRITPVGVGPAEKFRPLRVRDGWLFRIRGKAVPKRHGQVDPLRGRQVREIEEGVRHESESHTPTRSMQPPSQAEPACEVEFRTPSPGGGGSVYETGARTTVRFIALLCGILVMSFSLRSSIIHQIRRSLLIIGRPLSRCSQECPASADVYRLPALSATASADPSVAMQPVSTMPPSHLGRPRTGCSGLIPSIGRR